MGKRAACNCKVDCEVYQQKFTQEQRILVKCEANGPMLWVTIPARLLFCEGRVDRGVCSVRQYGLWCAFCVSLWTVACVLYASVDCGMCSVRQILHA